MWQQNKTKQNKKAAAAVPEMPSYICFELPGKLGLKEKKKLHTFSK